MKRYFISIIIVLLIIVSALYIYENTYSEKVPTDVIEKDIIILKTGEEYSGEIINQTDVNIVIKPIVVGNINVTYTFKYDEIKDIIPGRSKVKRILSNPLLKSYYEIENYKEDINELYLNGEFEKLEKEISFLRNNKSRFASGEWKLDIFYSALIENYRDMPIDNIMESINKLETWKKNIPKSITPIILLINANKNLAWKYRGTTFSGGISEQGREKMQKHLEIAQDLINNIDSEFEIIDPRFYSSSLAVSLGLGDLESKLTGFLQKSIAYDPDYYNIYTTTAPFLLPRWIGKSGSVEGFADWASNQTDGNEQYARVANSIRDYVGESVYKKIDLKWSRIRSGFQDITNKYPSNFYQLHSYIWMACYYDYYELAKHLTDKSGYAWNPQSNDVWGSFSNYYNCKTLANSDRTTIKIDIHKKIRKGNYSNFVELIKGDIDLNAKNADGETPLYYAIDSHFYDFADVLIKSGADIRLADEYGIKPIHLAAKNGIEYFVALLLDKGAPVNVQTVKSWSPLHYAARYGHIDVIKLLLSNKEIDVNVKNNIKRTPLHQAVFLGSYDMVSLLLEKEGINVNAADRHHNTPLNWAKKYGYDEISKLLISKGAKSNPDAITNEEIEHASDLVNKGIEAHNKGDYSKAKEFYLKALEVNPYKPDIYGNIALINMFEHDYEACFENTSKAIELDNDNAHAIYSAAQCLFMLNKPKDEILYYYQRYVELESNSFKTEELLQKYPELKQSKK